MSRSLCSLQTKVASASGVDTQARLGLLALNLMEREREPTETIYHRPWNNVTSILHGLQIMGILDRVAIIQKSMDYSPFKKAWTIVHAFFQKMAQKSPQIFITFSDTY